jgi:hypothetical protein
LLAELQNPAYQHLLINHLPIIGTAMGVVALVVGLAVRQQAALLPGLVILLVAGISAWPVHETGSAAYKPIRKISDDSGSDWLDEHMDRADSTVWFFYTMAGLAGLAMTVPRKWPSAGVPLAVASAMAGVVCTGVAGYIARPGGLVRHTEFRPSATQAEPAKEQPAAHDAKPLSGK